MTFPNKRHLAEIHQLLQLEPDRIIPTSQRTEKPGLFSIHMEVPIMSWGTIGHVWMDTAGADCIFLVVAAYVSNGQPYRGYFQPLPTSSLGLILLHNPSHPAFRMQSRIGRSIPLQGFLPLRWSVFNPDLLMEPRCTYRISFYHSFFLSDFLIFVWCELLLTAV